MLKGYIGILGPTHPLKFCAALSLQDGICCCTVEMSQGIVHPGQPAENFA